MAASPKWGLWILLALAAAAFVFWLWPRSGNPPPATASRISASADAPDRAAILPAETALPAADADARDVYQALHARADAGDAVAACRLAVTLIDCRQARAMAPAHYRAAGDPEAAFEKEGNLEAANHLAQIQLNTLLMQQRCEGLGDDQIAEAGHYLRRAAQAGIGEALVRYADGQGFAAQTPFGALREPGFDPWRREALPSALRALRQGEPAAVALLYVAYSDDATPFAGLVADDPVRTQAYRALMHRLRGKNVPNAAGLTADQNAQAQALAARIHREDFAAKVLPPGTRVAATLYSDWMTTQHRPRDRCR